MTSRKTLAPLLALALGAAGCGGSTTKTVTQTVAHTPTATTPRSTATTPAPTATSTTPAPTTSSPPATTPATPSPPAQQSCGTTAGHFIRQIQTANADCSSARQVANAWLARVQGGADPAKPISVGGYVCAARFRGQLAVALCRNGPSRIVFAAQP